MYVVINKEIYSLVGRGQLLPVGNGIFFFFFFGLRLTTRGHGITKLDLQPPLNIGVSAASAFV